MVLLLAASGCSRQVSFSEEVKPILRDNCMKCHDGGGEGSSKSEFKVNTYDDVMKGTKFGKVVIPGDSESSTLYRLVAHKAGTEIQMPPHHSETRASEMLEPLPAEQIDIIKMWIDQGAKNN